MPIDFSLLDAEMDFDGGLAAETRPEPSSVIDFSDPNSILTSKNWLTATAKQRKASAPVAFSKFVDALEKDRSKTIQTTNGAGETIEAPIVNPSGGFTREGLDYVERVKRVFDTAAEMDDGGAGYDDHYRTYALNADLQAALVKPPKQPDPFRDLDDFLQERASLAAPGDQAAVSYDDYVDFANAEVRQGEARLDKDNPEMKKAFARETAKRTFDPSTMDESEIIRPVGDAYVINPANYAEIDKVEAAIDALPIDAAQKRLMRIDYRSKVEQNIGEIVNSFAAADAGVLGSVVSSPLRDEFIAAAADPNSSGYEFLKANKERMSKDGYGLGSELAAKFRDATMATGSGALWLAGAAVDVLPGVDGVGEFLSAPAQAWGGLAEDTAKAYHNQTAFSIGGIEVKRRDLTELAGQLGSMIVMGGVGSSATKALGLGTKAATTGAAAAATEAAVAKSLGRKSVDFLKAAASDPTAYFGGVQAAGMSFGRTYNEAFERTGSRDQAYKEASVSGIADGLSALIATGLMNRVAPGAERLMGAKEGALGQSLIQNLRSRSVGAAGLKAMKEDLEKLAESGGEALRKEFVKDLAKSMNGKAKSLGLRGLGLAGEAGSEMVEESMDEAISDAIKAMADDSKSWTEAEWGNIHDNWRQYVKAGILGALGGGAGGVYSAVQSNVKGARANDALKAEWGRIKENVEQFADHNLMSTVDDTAVNLAEYIASDAPVEKKSQALLHAAMGRGAVADFGSAVADDILGEEPTTNNNESGQDAQQTATGNADNRQKPADVGADNGDLQTAEGFVNRTASVDGQAQPPRQPDAVSPDAELKGRAKELAAKLDAGEVTVGQLHQMAAWEKAPGSALSNGPANEEAAKNKVGAVALIAARGLSQPKSAQVSEPATAPSAAITAAPVAKAAPVATTPTPQTDGSQEKRKADAQIQGQVLNESASQPLSPRARGVVLGEVARQSGMTVVVGNAPEHASWPARKGTVLVGKDAWHDTKENKAGLSQALVERVMADPSLPDVASKVAFLKQTVDALSGKAEKSNVKLQAPAADSATTKDKPVRKPAKATSYYINPEKVASKEPDEHGGVWSRDRDVYTYTPKKGKTLQFGLGDVLHLNGNPDEVLVLNSVNDGSFVFRRVELSKIVEMFSDPEAVRRVDSLQNNWTRTRLGEVQKLFVKDGGFDRLVDGTMDAEEMGRIFMAALRVVAPDMDPAQLVRRRIKGDGYMHATLVNRKNLKGKDVLLPVMEVDMAKLAAELRKPFLSANLDNEAARPLLALEAARLLSLLIEEEQIHMLTLDQEKFGKDELEQFYRDIWEDKESPFHPLLVETIERRFPGYNPDPDLGAPKTISEANDFSGLYMAASELIRKIHQLRIGGSYSEAGLNEARALTAAINADGGAKGVKGITKAVAELLRRYTARLAKVLRMRWLQGRLPASQRDLLARLNDEYKRANIRGDVEMMASKATGSWHERLRLFTQASEEEVGDVAKKHSDALIALRDLPKMFSKLTLDDLLEVDKETLAIRLRPIYRKHLETRSSANVDLTSIDEALAALNNVTYADDKTPLYGATSYQKALVQAFLAKEVMESAREEVEVDSRAFHDWFTSGVTDDPRGIDSFIVANAPTDREQIQNHNSVRMLRNSRRDIEKQIDQLEQELALDSIREVENADPEKIDGWKTLFRYARMMGFEFKDGSIGENGTWRSMADLKAHVMAMVGMTTGQQPTRFTPKDSKSLVELDRLTAEVGALHRAEVDLMAAFSANIDSGVMRMQRAAELEAEAKAATTRDAASLRRQAALLRSMASVDVNVAGERYDAFRRFLDAVDAYNDSVRNVMRRAVGDFDNYKSQDYGVRFTNTQHDEQIKPDDISRLDPLKGIQHLPRAMSAGDVFGFNQRTAEESAENSDVPGYSYAKNPNDNDSPETKEFKRRYKFTLESNAAFVGRMSWLDFAHIEMKGLLPADFNVAEYASTGGFNLSFVSNPDIETVDYESPAEAFPKFVGIDDLLRANNALDKLDKGVRSDASIIEGYLAFFDRAEKYVAHIRKRITGIAISVGDQQALSARVKMMLLPRLDEFEQLLENGRERLIVSMSGLLVKKTTMDSYGNIREDFERHEDTEENRKAKLVGMLKLQPEANYGRVNTALTQSFTPTLKGSPMAVLSESMFLLNHAVTLSRKSLSEFLNENWRGNVEHEMDRVIRDDAYLPDHAQLLDLRDQAIDLRTVMNLLFLLQYHENPNTYRLGAAFAMDALDEHRKLNRGDGGGVFVKKKAKTVYEKRKMHVLSKSGWETTDKNYPVGSVVEDINDEDIVSTVDSLDAMGNPVTPFGLGATGNTVRDYLEQGEDDYDTMANSAIRRQAQPEQALKKWVSRWGMLYGYQSRTRAGSAADAKRFLHDIVNQELGLGSALDVDRLIRQGIAGAFPSIINGDSTHNSLVEQFYSRNPEYAKTNSLPASRKDLVHPSEEQLTIGFNAEKFLVDLSEFKLGFDNQAIEMIRVTKQDRLSRVLATVLREATAAGRNPDLAETFRTFGESHRETYGQDLFDGSSRPSRFTNDEELASIAKLIHKGMTGSKRIGFMDARLMSGEQELSYISSNPMVSMLLQRAPSEGEVIVVVGESKDLWKSGEKEIGLRVFPGRDGLPTVIFAPQDQNGPRASSADNEIAIANALLAYAQDEEMGATIDELAASVRDALDPVIYTQGILDRIRDSGSMKAAAAAKSVVNAKLDFAKQVEDHAAIRRHNAQLARLDSVRKREMVKLLGNHLLRLAEFGRANGLTGNTAAANGLFEGEPTRVGNVLLLAGLLTNPMLKNLFDQAYVGTDDVNANLLNRDQSNALGAAIAAITGQVQDNSDAYYDDSAYDIPEFYERLINGEDVEVEGEPARDDDPTISEALEPLADDLSRIFADEPDVFDYTGSGNLGPNVRELNEWLANAVGKLAKPEPKSLLDDVDFSDQVVWPSDALLFNGLAALISAANDRNGVLSQEQMLQRLFESGDKINGAVRANTVARDMLGTARGLGGPIIAARNPDGSMYSGEIHRLSLPRGPGGTMQTRNFNHARRLNAQAAILGSLPRVRGEVEPKAIKAIREVLLEKGEEARFPQIRHEVPLTDFLLDDLREALPTGLLDRELAAVDQMLSGLAATRDEWLAQESWALGELAAMDAEFTPDEVETMLGNAELQSATLREQMADWTVRFVRNFATGSGKQNARLANVLSLILSDNLNNRFAEGNAKGLSDILHNHLFELSRLIQRRDSIESTRDNTESMLGQTYREGSVAEINKAITERVKAFNATAASLNQLVNREFNAMLREVRRGVSKKTDSPSSLFKIPTEDEVREMEWIRPFRMEREVTDEAFKPTKRRKAKTMKRPVFDPTKLTMASLREMSSRVSESLSRPKTEERFANRLVGQAVDQLIQQVDSLLESETGRPNRRAVDALVHWAKQAAENETVSKQDIVAKLESAFDAVDLKEDKTGVFTDLLNLIALNTDEARTLIRDRAQTPDQRMRRMRLEEALRNARREAANASSELTRLLSNDGQFELGRYHHNLNVGLEGQTAKVGGKTLERVKAISPDERKLAVSLSLVHPAVANLADETPTQQGRLKQAYNRNEDQRRAFYVRSMAVKRALDELTDQRLDEAYRKIRGRSENFNRFNPLAMIAESIHMVELEKALLEERFNEAGQLAGGVPVRGMSAEAIAMATAPGMGNDIYTRVSEGGSAKRARRYRAPENWNDRLNLIGRLFDDGEPIALVATNAREQLMKAFPERITKRNVNRELSGLVLDAMSMDEEGPETAASYLMGFGAEHLDSGRFDSNRFEVTRGKNLSLREAGKVFSDHFRKMLGVYLKNARNGGQDRKRQFDMSGSNTKATLDIYGSLVEKLVYALDDPALDGETSKRLMELLASIDDGSFIGTDEKMAEFDLVGTFAEVFAQIESEHVMATLASGLSIQTAKPVQMLMKSVHHHDARTRMRFLRNHKAREIAMHIQGLLEDGFDGKSGRVGADIAKKASQEAIAKAAGKIKNGNALDQTIGYLVAQLDGLEHSNGLGVREALVRWVKDLKYGHEQLLALDKAQRGTWGKVGRFFKANHVDLLRDLPLSNRILEILEKTKAMDHMASLERGLASDQEARSVIASFRKNLLDASVDTENVKGYAATLLKEFGDLSNAMAVSRAILSKPQKDVQPGEEHSKWKHQPVPPVRQTYSSVPMRLAYASNPKADRNKVDTEGRFISDPIDIVAISESSFFGGAGRREASSDKAAVFRPLAINGLAAPLSLVEDATYRMNVTPNYEVLYRLMGRVVIENGIPTINTDKTKAGFLTKTMQESEWWERESKEYKVALAAVNSDMEQIIQNDSQQGVVNTGFSQVARFLSSMYVVRALASVQQMLNQTVPPVASFVMKKVATGQFREAGDFLIALGRLFTSFSTYKNGISDGDFFDRTRQFVKKVSPSIHYRSLDGQDVVRNELRGQLRYGAGTMKAWTGRLLKEYENLGENVLDAVIGKGERMVSRSIFLAELMSEMRRELGDDAPKTLDELLSMDAGLIPIVSKQYAQIKVSDMMGQSDMSKKSAMFQSHSTSPAWSALLKSLVRFSNYSATTASNLSAWMPVMSDFMVSKQQRQYDERTRSEAVENIVGTLGQNIMFHFIKIQTLVPLALYLMYGLGGDDDDEAAEKAQEKANEILFSSEDSNPFASFIKDFAIGRERQLFSDTKDTDAARASAAAELSAKSLQEIVQATPYVGVLAGYSPISALVKPYLDRGSEEVMAMAYDLEAGEGRWSPEAVNVRDYKPGLVEAVTQATAPTAVAYDGLESAVLSYQAYKTGEASAMNVALYLISEAIAPLRDYRAARQQQLQQIVRDYGDDE